ncbi:hypothetical protein [Alteromonas flava]|uniref:hypothetical protein n=1 Tax=Alteromonas flava TaxID=2048003 RepID=UPI000C286165|nr:hypothetical protein [Alteromonas flava]
MKYLAIFITLLLVSPVGAKSADVSQPATMSDERIEQNNTASDANPFTRQSINDEGNLERQRTGNETPQSTVAASHAKSQSDLLQKFIANGKATKHESQSEPPPEPPIILLMMLVGLFFVGTRVR